MSFAALAARHRFTVEEYHRMAEVGLLGEDDRVELLEGQIIDLSPIASRHAACVNRLNHLLAAGLAGRAIVSVQNPVRVGDLSEPQPDVAVLRDRPDFYDSEHPGPDGVLVLIEVADTSLAFDRDVKAFLYARGGVATPPERASRWTTSSVELTEVRPYNRTRSAGMQLTENGFVIAKRSSPSAKPTRR